MNSFKEALKELLALQDDEELDCGQTFKQLGFTSVLLSELCMRYDGRVDKKNVALRMRADEFFEKLSPLQKQ